MQYIHSILWFMSFPACIIISYYLSLFMLKKLGKYDPVSDDQVVE
ncbi:MAG: hypothetical protein ACWA6U_06375 [Breznakibacter sp.]